MKTEAENHPFINHKEQFKKIPVEERSDWNKRMIQIQQMQGAPKQMFKQDYGSTGLFEFKGTNMHYYYQKITQEPQALLFFFHGLNSHGNNSGYFGVNIAKSIKKVNVFALDFKNFGQSEGEQRGYIEEFAESVAEAEGFVDYILSQYKNKPKIFLSGSSFGGTIVFKMAIDKPEKYSGLILLSPAIRELKQSQYLMKKFGLAMGYLFPKLKIITQTYTSGTKYHMPEVMTKDKYNYTDKVIPGSIRTVLNAMEEVETQYQKLNTPYLLFQSGVDKLVDPFAPLDLEEQCKVQDKTTIYCKDMWHAVFYEEEIEHIVPISIDWLQKRL